MSENTYQQDFLWFSYFGISKSEADSNEEMALKKCVQRAYLDLSRTLDFIRSSSWLESSETKKEHANERDSILHAKEKFKQDCENYIILKIKEMFHSSSQADFDRLHSELCKGIKLKAREIQVVFREDEGGMETKKPLFQERGVTYGQAQKWVNMTLKNMLIMDLWREVDHIRKYLHVPLDSYIIAAAERKLRIENPKVRWSNMDDEEMYLDYQQKIRNSVKPLNPIAWEGSAWIEQAKIESRN